MKKELGERYWDSFQLRISETAAALKAGTLPPLRRLSLHVTNRCNMKCGYCNEKHSPDEMDMNLFCRIVKEYSAMGGGVLHMTGGEPACVPWLFDTLAVLGPIYTNVDFHLNTNAAVEIPDATLAQIKRLKISLDSSNSSDFDELVGVKGAFMKVFMTLCRIDDMNRLGKGPTCSVTYTMSKQNYLYVPKFLDWFHSFFPHIYAVFISAYKGHDPKFEFTAEDIDRLFTKVVPEIDACCDKFKMEETKFLFHASHAPVTFVADDRFPENRVQPCYLQLSELVIDETGDIGNCSHLYRDKVRGTELNVNDMPLAQAFRLAKEGYDLKPMHEKCAYGCNKKLVTFNTQVGEKLFVN